MLVSCNEEGRERDGGAGQGVSYVAMTPSRQELSAAVAVKNDDDGCKLAF